MGTSSIVQGILKPDGTLELDHKPNLTPGRVQVIVQALPPPASAKRGLTDVIDDIKQAQLARGYSGRTSEEMDSEETERQIEEGDYDRRMDGLWSQTGSGSSARTP